MREESGTYLECPLASHVRALATLVAVELLAAMRFDKAKIQSAPVDIAIRFRIEPLPDPADSPPPPTIRYRANAHLEAEYSCFLDGFGSYREKLRREISNGDFRVPKNEEFQDISSKAIPVSQS